MLLVESNSKAASGARGSTGQHGEPGIHTVVVHRDDLARKETREISADKAKLVKLVLLVDDPMGPQGVCGPEGQTG